LSSACSSSFDCGLIGADCNGVKAESASPTETMWPKTLCSKNSAMAAAPAHRQCLEGSRRLARREHACPSKRARAQAKARYPVIDPPTAGRAPCATIMLAGRRPCHPAHRVYKPDRRPGRFPLLTFLPRAGGFRPCSTSTPMTPICRELCIGAGVHGWCRSTIGLRRRTVSPAAPRRLPWPRPRWGRRARRRSSMATRRAIAVGGDSAGGCPLRGGPRCAFATRGGPRLVRPAFCSIP